MQLSGTVHYSSEGKRGIVILGLFDLANILSLFEKTFIFRHFLPKSIVLGLFSLGKIFMISLKTFIFGQRAWTKVILFLVFSFLILQYYRQYYIDLQS